ncbi:hypothetical protein D9615_005686 [Tricholomella constricta]|uniref:Uncharacterized protein n=1 Tax=Tricholomella constricta TaxID=117010 RepID=A0A8H5HA84_9AGAR|nr:hypothetical protein D9615_005686 [Tricholomella constricta]
MLYKNSQPLAIDDQQHPALIGCPALKLRKISMTKRISWPHKLPGIVSLEQGGQNVQTTDPSDMENVVSLGHDIFSQTPDDLSTRQQVFLHPSSFDDAIHAPPRSPGLKDGRQILNRSSRSRVPSVRTPPSDLWNITPSKFLEGAITSTSSEIGPGSASYSGWVQQSHINHRPTSEREPLRTMAQAQAPIGSERHQWTSTPGAGWSSTPVTAVLPLPPGCATQKAPVRATTTFVDVLIDNKRKNPHAPSMVSMFNPLREKVPFRAWACIPSSPWQAWGASGTLALSSARFRTALYAMPVRSRRDCEWASTALLKGKVYWLNKIRNHCRDCKHESLCKKLLVFAYQMRQARFLYRPPSPNTIPFPGDDDDSDMEVDDQKTASSDENLLDSPTLRDFDDFDDFDDFGDGHPEDDALLRDHEDVDMGDRSLF